MAAAAKKKQSKAVNLRLEPDRSTYISEDVSFSSEVAAEIRLESRAQMDLPPFVEVGIDSRGLAMERGERITGRLYVADRESTDDKYLGDPVLVYVDELEALGKAISTLGREAKRYGILPPQEG
jgi:hypothetical protein